MPMGRRELEFFAQLGVLDLHVFEFAGLENFATFEAFDKLGVFVARYYFHTRMLTLFHLTCLLVGIRRRD